MTITFEQFHTCDACGCDLPDKDECICQVCKHYNNVIEQVKAAILELAAMGSCTLIEMQEDVSTQVPGVNELNAHALCIKAKAALIDEGLLEQGANYWGLIYNLTLN